MPLTKARPSMLCSENIAARLRCDSSPRLFRGTVRFRSGFFLLPLFGWGRARRAGALRGFLTLHISEASFAFGSYTVLLSHAFLYRLKQPITQSRFTSTVRFLRKPKKI